MLFSGNNYGVRPAPDEVELTLLGPGFGEAVCVHLGDGRWVLIDSCVMPGQTEPASLRYLEDLGFSGNDVIAVVASHWDDDHIRGFAKLIEACPSADPVMSLAFKEKDFHSFVEAYGQPLTTRARSGVREIRETFEVLRKAGRTKIKMAGPARRIYGPNDISLDHGQPMEMWTLSPSSDEYQDFLTWLAHQMPTIRETRRVAVRQIRNDLSVVVHITVGPITILIGGDLEKRGWSALLSETGGPSSRASAFKVAHHGSETGDDPRIWSDLLTPDPIAVLAPWRLGGGDLPAATDAQRILSKTTDAFSTAIVPARATKLRPAAVKRQLRAMKVEPRLIEQTPGMLRLRRKVTDSAWTVEQIGGAVHLSKVHA